MNMGMTDQQIAQLFSGLTIDLNDLHFVMQNKPLLAHYTSIDVLEKIMKTDEIWLSNPLFMNDLEEVRFGIRAGATLFLQSDLITEACGKSDKRVQRLKQAFSYYYAHGDHARVGRAAWLRPKQTDLDPR